MNDQPAVSQVMAQIGKIIRLGMAAGCLWLVMFWEGATPPVLDISQTQVTEGIYQCILHTGGKYGATGPDIVDGILYYDHFSYLFGIHAPTPCFQELNGHKVRLYYLIPTNSTRRLTLEVTDLKSGRSFGVLKEKMFALYQEQVADKWPFYLSKLALLLLALRLIFWGSVKKFF